MNREFISSCHSPRNVKHLNFPISSTPTVISPQLSRALTLKHSLKFVPRPDCRCAYIISINLGEGDKFTALHHDSNGWREAGREHSQVCLAGPLTHRLSASRRCRAAERHSITRDRLRMSAMTHTHVSSVCIINRGLVKQKQTRRSTDSSGAGARLDSPGWQEMICGLLFMLSPVRRWGWRQMVQWQEVIYNLGTVPGKNYKLWRAYNIIANSNLLCLITVKLLIYTSIKLYNLHL